MTTPATYPIRLRIPRPLYERARAAAESDGLTLHQWIRRAWNDAEAAGELLGDEPETVPVMVRVAPGARPRQAVAAMERALVADLERLSP